jgi:hypothetical protein
MTSRDAYRAFCAGAPDLPLFCHDWYLDAVCAGGRWDAVLASKNGRVAAVLPYFLKTRFGRPYVAMPPLARFMGPYLLPEYRRSRHEPALLEALIDGLPRLAAFEQDCHYHLANWLPFYWRGFRQTTRYSYTLPLGPPETLRPRLSADYRNNKIPKAEARVKVQTGGALDDFFRLHNRSYERQGLQPPVSFEFLQRLDAALAAHGCRELFFARDRSTGALHSVAYLAWDQCSAYYLLAGDDPDLRSSGAGVLIAWEAIRYAATLPGLETFDFAGSMVRSIERVRRKFGAEQQPYFRLQKEWSPLWRWGKKLWR